MAEANPWCGAAMGGVPDPVAGKRRIRAWRRAMSPPENREEGLKRGLSAHRKYLQPRKEGSCLGMSCSKLATHSAFHACFCAAFLQAVQLRTLKPTFSASRCCLLPASPLWRAEAGDLVHHNSRIQTP